MRRAIVSAVVLGSLAWAAPAGALPPDGKRWRALTETTGVTAAQLAAVCPRDGESRCTGTAGNRNVNGWIWATSDQVLALMGHSEPRLLEADPTQVSGPEYLFSALTFVDEIRPTFFFSGYSSTNGYVGGWTASERDGLPVLGSASYQHPIFNGSFFVGPSADGSSAFNGAWLWRPASDDLTPPVVRAVVSGTAGSNGWYTSDVSVSWDVSDPESAVTSSCDPASVTEDTAGVTFTCTATSGGGTTSASTVVKRDALAPTVTCGAAPTFQLGQVGARVSATVADATSGPLAPLVYGNAATGAAGTFNASVLGVDRAGNRTTVSCPYVVASPSCNGLPATIVGTAGNNTINGTSGRDVIAGLGGIDTIYGGGGNDVICGGDGNDEIEGGSGDDWLDGGAGSDSLRGDGGRDTCLSGERRTSSCEVF